VQQTAAYSTYLNQIFEFGYQTTHADERQRSYKTLEIIKGECIYLNELYLEYIYKAKGGKHEANYLNVHCVKFSIY